MKLILCLMFLTIMGLVLLSDTRSAKGCTDWDEDGFSVCEGDCENSDPSIHKCGSIDQMYSLIYHRLTNLADRGSRLLLNFITVGSMRMVLSTISTTLIIFGTALLTKSRIIQHLRQKGYGSFTRTRSRNDYGL
jgi:hypothetical protein